MSNSKSNGANYGARRVINKNFGFTITAKPPKKKPLGYDDDEDDNKRNKPRRS